MNDVNLGNQTNKVLLGADAPFRQDVDGMAQIHVRGRTGRQVPLSALATTEKAWGRVKWTATTSIPQPPLP